MKLLAATPQATNEVRVRGEELAPVLWRGKQWAVTKYGIEARDGTYTIEKSRISQDWPEYSHIRHMQEKNWVDMHDFALVYAIAIETHGIRLHGP